MGLKISEYVNTGTSLSASDLTEFSKLISTSPDVWQTQKFPYSVLLTELTADLNFVEGSGTINYIPKFSGAGTIADGIMQDDGATISLGGALDATMKFRMYADKPFGLYVDNTAASGSQHISLYGKSIAANTASNTGFYGEALGSTGGTNLGARGKAADTTIQDSAVDILYAGANTGGFFQANKSGAYVTYGLVGSADSTALEAASTHVGGFFRAINAGTKYSVRLIDGSEGIGKFLKSIDANGNANWATVNDYTADATPDSAADYLLSWDASASLHKKVLMSNIPSSAVTIYGADATFSAARTAKLSGNTSSEYLAFQTLAGNNILKLKGDSSIDFGASGVGVKKNHYGINSSSGDSYYGFSTGLEFMRVNYSNGKLEFVDHSGNINVNIQSYGATNRGLIQIIGNDSSFSITNTSYLTSIVSQVGAGANGSTTFTNHLGVVKAAINCQGFISVGADATGNYALEATGTSWFNGAVSFAKITTYTAASVTADNDYTLLCDATSNAITVNLPTAVGIKGRIYVVVKTDVSVNTVTVDPSAAQTVNGAATAVLSAQWSSYTVQSDNANWVIIATA